MNSSVYRGSRRVDSERLAAHAGSMELSAGSHLYLALSLAVVVAACGGTRSAISRQPEEFAGLILFIQETPDGQVRHFWRRGTELDWGRYDSLLGGAEGRPIILVSRRPRDCDEEHIDCYRSCMKRRLPSHLSHIPRGSGAHGAYCANTCLQDYMDCLEQQQSRALEFPVLSDAMDWLRRHRKEVVVGTIVVIAGVAFVAISAGAGLVVLAPVALVAS